MKQPYTFKGFSVIAFTAILVSYIFAGCHKTDSFRAVTTSDHSSLKKSAASTKPNIVFILFDDIGSEVPTCYGGQSYQTPNMDMLAQQGIRFTQCYGSPSCSPSRFMLMTGKYNFRNYTLWGKMNPDEKTFATLLRDAGYATYVAGKWQFDGGDASIHSLGFNDYTVWLPFAGVPLGSHYKSPTIYTQASYLDPSLTLDKYGEDIFTDSVLQFIDSNRERNFFVYFPITLSHSPFGPTPDDSAAFANWTSNNPSDTTYFPSMVKYMDKKVGQVVDHLKELGLFDNTIILIAGDNGTSGYITSTNNGQRIRGGKGKTNVFGTKLPLIVSCPNLISNPGYVDTTLVDFTDFLPTFADAAGISVPAEYGIIDGKSFYPQLQGDFSNIRSWVFNHFQPAHEDEGGFAKTDLVQSRLERWANTSQYKLYDSTYYFYDIIRDPYEKKPLTRLTPAQRQIRNNLFAVISSMHN